MLNCIEGEGLEIKVKLNNYKQGSYSQSHNRQDGTRLERNIRNLRPHEVLAILSSLSNHAILFFYYHTTLSSLFQSNLLIL